MADRSKENKPALPVFEAVLIIFVLLPFVLYFIKFGGGSFSSDQQYWAHFATFVSAFAAIANLYVVYMIAKAAERINIKAQEENRLFQDGYEKPVLYLSQRLQSKAWYITNMGRGAALNIKIAIEFAPFGGDESGIRGLIKGYSLAANKDSLIVKVDHRRILRFIIVYEDVRQRKFVSIANNHETIIEELDSFKTVVFDDGYQFSKSDLEDVLKMKPTNPDAFALRYLCYIFPTDLLPK